MKMLILLLSLLLPLSAVGEPADMDSLLARLESSSWVAEGAESPQRVAYVFTDMACPYCARLWENMQPLVNHPDNTLQVRPVG